MARTENPYNLRIALTALQIEVQIWQYKQIL